MRILAGRLAHAVCGKGRVLAAYASQSRVWYSSKGNYGEVEGMAEKIPMKLLNALEEEMREMRHEMLTVMRKIEEVNGESSPQEFMSEFRKEEVLREMNWRLSKVSQNLSNQILITKLLELSIANKDLVSELEDWYRASRKIIRKLFGF